MTRSPRLLPAGLLLGLALFAAAPLAQAQGLRPSSVFVQAGGGEDKVKVASVGLAWPWAWKRAFAGGELGVQTEFWASRWRYQATTGGHDTLVQLNLVPVLRWRPSQGTSPWFVEGGIGASYTDTRLTTPNKQFSTRWNFSDNVAVGRSFGAQNQHELSLRWQHTSNASIRRPNPGLDLFTVRYATRF